jgi:hypothetical protein
VMIRIRHTSRCHGNADVCSLTSVHVLLF